MPPLFTESAPAAPNPAQATAPAPKAPAVSPELQATYAEISRRDAAVRKQELSLAAKQKELEALSTKYGDLDKIKGNAGEVLKRFGLTPDQILLEQLGKKPPTPKVEEQIEQLRAQIEEDRKARETEGLTAKQQQEQQQIAYFRQNVASEVTQKIDKYPLANALGMHGHIADEMGVYFEEYGKAPSVDMIAAAAESFVAEAMKKAGWTPPRAKGAAAPAATPADGHLFSAVEEAPRRDPKNQEVQKKFSLSDRVRTALGQ